METIKILNIIMKLFLIAFLVSALLILTNALNMWLVGIVSLIITIILFIIIQVLKHRNKK